MPMTWSRHKDLAKIERTKITASMTAILPTTTGGARGNPPEQSWLMNPLTARSTGGGNLVDEIANVPFDFGSLQAVA